MFVGCKLVGGAITLLKGGRLQTTVATHVRIVAADHLAVGDLVAEAVGGLIGVDGHVQHLGAQPWRLLPTVLARPAHAAPAPSWPAPICNTQHHSSASSLPKPVNFLYYSLLFTSCLICTDQGCQLNIHSYSSAHLLALYIFSKEQSEGYYEAFHTTLPISYMELNIHSLLFA